MKNLIKNNVMAGSFTACGLLLALLLVALPAAAQAPVVNQAYTLKVFATAPRGISQPDSIVQWGDHIIVGFEKWSGQGWNGRKTEHHCAVLAKRESTTDL
jgi:hypothetical protein